MSKHNETRVRLEGFQYGPLYGQAYMPFPDLPDYGYHVMSDCGKVAFTVNTRKAESSIKEAQDNDSLPVFFYS
jgi:hypothetical protein